MSVEASYFAMMVAGDVRVLQCLDGTWLEYVHDEDIQTGWRNIGQDDGPPTHWFIGGKDGKVAEFHHFPTVEEAREAAEGKANEKPRGRGIQRITIEPEADGSPYFQVAARMGDGGLVRADGMNTDETVGHIAALIFLNGPLYDNDRFSRLDNNGRRDIEQAKEAKP